MKRKWGLFFNAAFILILTACSSTKGFKTLDAQEITMLGDNCEEIYIAQIEAWKSKDPENLRLVYTDDIVHFDSEPAFIGIDRVVNMAKRMFRGFRNWEMDAGETYISKDQCFGTWINWNTMGKTQENPGLEYDLLDTRDNKIYFWRLFYDPNFFSEPPQSLMDDLAKFESNWSKSDSVKLMEMYSEDAELDDSLFGISISGHRKISDYADSFFMQNPGLAWHFLSPFSEGEAGPNYIDEYPVPSYGGVFTISVLDTEKEPCEIRAVVILTPDENGKIQKQQNFYNADSLIECGWAK